MKRTPLDLLFVLAVILGLGRSPFLAAELTPGPSVTSISVLPVSSRAEIREAEARSQEEPGKKEKPGDPPEEKGEPQEPPEKKGNPGEPGEKPKEGEGKEKGKDPAAKKRKAAEPPADNLALPDSLSGRNRERLEESIEDLQRLLTGRGSDVDKIVRNLRRAAKGEGGGQVAQYYLGVAYNLDEKFDKADQALSSCLEENPRFYEALRALGDVRVNQLDLAAAVELYDQALAIYPDYQDALRRKAEVLIQMGQVADASAVYASLEAISEDKNLPLIRTYIEKFLEGPQWDEAFVAETDNYIVKTGVSQEFADDIAACAEQVRRLYGEYFEEIPRIGRKYEIYAYRDKADYHRHGGPKTAGGHYSPFLRTLNIYKYAKRSDTLLVLNHEGFHQYLHEYLPNIPQWFNEGLGDFFGGAHIYPGGKKARMGPNHWRVDLIKTAIQRDLCPTADELMNMSQQEMYGRNIGVHYAQAWAIVYYSMTAGKSQYKKAFQSYFSALRKGVSQSEAYRLAFGRLDMERFERDWRNFITKLPSRKEIQSMREKGL